MLKKILSNLIHNFDYHTHKKMYLVLEHRLKRGGYVDSTDIPSKKGIMKPVKKSLYSITPKGTDLLKGWISFLNAYKDN